MQGVAVQWSKLNLLGLFKERLLELLLLWRETTFRTLSRIHEFIDFFFDLKRQVASWSWQE